jgi:hypothetical protein
MLDLGDVAEIGCHAHVKVWIEGAGKGRELLRTRAAGDEKGHVGSLRLGRIE